jgi:hypothetical protein
MRFPNLLCAQTRSPVDICRLLDIVYSSSDSDDETAELEAVMQWRMPRSLATYEYPGELVDSALNRHAHPAKNWDRLPQHERDRRWISYFRMLEHHFHALLAMVQPHIRIKEASNTQMRGYQADVQLMVALFFLSHCTTLRVLADVFGYPNNSISECCIPNNSISECCIYPVAQALCHVLLERAETKVIRFPRTEDAMNRVMAGLEERFRLPGCIGAIDGTAIPMKQPSRTAAGGDSDAYWCYKGFPAMLRLFAFFYVEGMLLKSNVGSPGNRGDAAVYALSTLKQQIDEGMLRKLEIDLQSPGDNVKIHPYLVGDAAFPTGPHMIKTAQLTEAQAANDPASAALAALAALTRRVTNCRSSSEMGIGRAKGRWSFLTRNKTYSDPARVRLLCNACCGLHIFCEERRVPFDDRVPQHEGAQLQQAPPAPAAQAGSQLQSKLKSGCK